MTDSLIKKLNEDKPKRAEIFDLLGTPELEGRIRCGCICRLKTKKHLFSKSRLLKK